MTRQDEIEIVMARVSYPFRTFRIGELGDGHYLQVVFNADGKTWHGRKWYISPHAIPAEIVQTALKAALTSAEHEVREHFLYQGRAVFGPHLDLGALHSIADTTVERPSPDMLSA